MVRRKDQSKVAKGLARGLSQREAVRRAGYSASTAEKKAYQIVRRPLVQSSLTDALEGLGVSMTKIMQPVADALEAKVRIKVMGENGGLIQTDAPDHRIRLEGHDRAVALLGAVPKQIEMPAPARPGMIVNIIRVDAKAEPKVVQETGEAEPTRPNGHGGRLTVVITKRGNGSS